MNQPCDFFIFWLSKIHISSTVIVSSVFPPRYHLSSDQHRHITVLCYASFSWSQDELIVFVLSSDNASSHRIPSRAKTKTLNMHHHRQPASPDRLTPNLHYYKNIISALTTLSITQPHLHFASSLAKAPWHQSSTRRYRFLSPSSHAYHPSAQWHPRWWTSRASFAFRIAYQYVNSREKIF
jgi:hypothetical protein